MTTYQNIWLKRKLNELREEFLWCCCWCGSTDGLEFAHIENTGLNGQGRGRWKRYYDVKKNKDKFMLMCKECHKEFDGMLIINEEDIQIQETE